MSEVTIKDRVDQLGDFLIEVFHVVGLFVIGGTIVWSAIGEYLIIMQHESGFASLKDILLLFIYLELGAMTGVYFKTHRLPVIFLIFIAITAITRFLVIDMKELVSTDKFNVLIMVVSIMILTIAAGFLRYTDNKYKNSNECFK
ncbi:phosphate-starvation-inducible PsiE family protein [Candidatus Thioglobus sp.]|jgi:phosphate starvation-inducible membrane PsiE|uniref:phosphate-starvation-inducible protein PsiE n=1 Tax=Candidatus Thioglobus sp. TaxID=2026721 RepID=UPI00176D919C|nr:phosphate-starvation-inducible PsiE family protein [Candidatus Thioglobus sp.]HIF47490.1 phosphate-starvation-inducible protein PsiE [Candidatus Thioglobus sp.]HIL03224.1 phosphate-starvation-inducible protein PsiE [Candidatus Thioglobus autotrophicus]